MEVLLHSDYGVLRVIYLTGYCWRAAVAVTDRLCSVRTSQICVTLRSIVGCLSLKRSAMEVSGKVSLL